MFDSFKVLPNILSIWFVCKRTSYLLYRDNGKHRWGVVVLDFDNQNRGQPRLGYTCRDLRPKGPPHTHLAFDVLVLHAPVSKNIYREKECSKS